MQRMMFRHNRIVPRVACYAAAVVLTGASVVSCSSGGDEAAGSAPSAALSSDVSPEIAAAAAHAEELGLKFAVSHDEIVERAREEGAVVVQTSAPEFGPFEEGFETSFPFIDLKSVQLSGATTERFLLEAETPAPPRYDVAYLAPEAYDQIAGMTDWDIYGMAEAGILDIPLGMIDPERRTVVSPGNTGVALAYNRTLVSQDELPTSWDDLADPKWGRDQLGMAMDVDMNNIAVLAAADGWDVDRVVALSKKMAKNNPIWTDGHTAADLLVQSGEVAISPFVNLHNTVRIIDKAPDGPLQLAFIEPVPVRLSESMAVFNDDFAQAPYSALLFLEWHANDVAQSLLDADPVQASLYWEGSRMGEMIEGLDQGVTTHAQMEELPSWVTKVQEAFGFPSMS